MLEIQQIGQIAIPVDHLDTAIAFYRDTLGLEFLFQAPPALAFFKCGEVRLMLESNPPAGEQSYSSVIYFRVPDISQAYRKLFSQGVDFVDEPHRIAQMPDHDLWMAFFRDPHHNLLALMAELPTKK